MLHYHPNTELPQVCYFYLPPLNSRPAEVIAVLNSTCNAIQIPVPEEDIELFAFYQRPMTPEETARFGSDPAWHIFNSWQQLKSELQKYKVSAATIAQLLQCSQTMPLHELAVA